ncbi:MAG TPA: SDR family NAD(P)-dependent oxidoreductase [Actinospica sp.]|jgi:NAD(P)-dependent dehydrogenase (short-subunit alcohol dehydrogenase family)|nr:SDR family NAD(P)-dependent oxidoreductase [Actinospica sp.]
MRVGPVERIVLVTGAGSGIGRAVALAAAEAGAAAVAVLDKSADSAAETAELVRAHGAKAEAVVCDVRDPGQLRTAVDGCAETFGGLDVLVNNAGIIETQLTDDCAVDTLPEDVWEAVYQVNLRAPWLATKYAAPHLRRSRRGPSIVNLASVSGLTGFRNGPAYCTTKGGLIQLTKVTAVDLSPDVRCNCVCPGVISTPMAAGFIAAADDPVQREREMASEQLIPRLGLPEEVAALVCYLASDAAAFTTGHAFPIDGGALAWRGRREPA